MRAARILIPLLASLLAGCVETVSSTVGDLIGPWNLESVNGDPLPVIVDESAEGRVELTADDIVFKADGTLTGSTTYRVSPAGGAAHNETFRQTGTWTRDGNAVNLIVIEDGVSSSSTAAIGEGSLTFSAGGTVFIYRR